MKNILVLISNYGTSQNDFCKNLLTGLSQINGYNFDIKIFSSEKNNFEGYEEIIINNYFNTDFSLGIYDYLKYNEEYIRINYDNILFTENDLFFSEENFDTYFKYSSKFEDNDYTIGFLRYEIKNDEKYLIDLHYQHLVDLEKKEGIIDFLYENSFFSLKNPHQGCFFIKSELFYNFLPKIKIGNSLEDKVSKIYYSENEVGSINGIKKYIPISDLEKLLIHHQPNKYVNKFTILTKLNDLMKQIENGTFL